MTEFDQEEEFVQDEEPLNQSSVNNHLSAEQLFAKSATSEDCWVNMDGGEDNIPTGGETHQGNTNGDSSIKINTFDFPIRNPGYTFTN